MLCAQSPAQASNYESHANDSPHALIHLRFEQRTPTILMHKQVVWSEGVLSSKSVNHTSVCCVCRSCYRRGHTASTRQWPSFWRAQSRRRGMPWAAPSQWPGSATGTAKVACCSPRYPWLAALLTILGLLLSSPTLACVVFMCSRLCCLLLL